MARYKVTIDTTNYVHQKCSVKNWEPGTVNDFMYALNGWHTTEYSLKAVKWRLELFHNREWLPEEWENNPDTPTGLSVSYTKWLNRKCNTIRYYDRLCGIYRTHRPSGYGFCQGYLPIDELVEKLKQEGEITIPFSSLYDIRQLSKNSSLRQCYMTIVKVA